MQWRYFVISPLREDGRPANYSHIFYAPTLSDAFVQARVRFGRANGWHCRRSYA